MKKKNNNNSKISWY